ncbi:MAG: hypothetical protein PG977_000568 [Bartonella clarridgeiae]|nr:MAG: hypothetical protein PG977_000568 [Bartonella clarridgeiae]
MCKIKGHLSAKDCEAIDNKDYENFAKSVGLSVNKGRKL